MSELNYPSNVAEITFHTNVLASCIKDKFGLDITKPDGQEKMLWLIEQLTDYAVNVQQLTGKFVVQQFAERYGFKVPEEAK